MSLFKRMIRGARQRFWSYKFDFRKDQILRATHFTDKTEARRLMEKHRLQLERDWAEHGTISSATDLRYRRRAVNGTSPSPAIKTPTTIGDIVKAFREKNAPLEAQWKTRKDYANALTHALRRTRAGDDVETLPISEINAQFVERFFSDAVARANAAENQESAARAKRSATSTLNQAIGVFSPAALRYFRKLGLDLPDIAAVKAAIQECRFRLTKHEHQAAPENVIEATLAAWELLDDRNIFLAVGLALAFGLRKGEIGQAKWGWLVEQGGQPFCSTTGAKVKDQTGRLTVRALDPFYSIMMTRATRRGWRGAPDDYILTGSDCARIRTGFYAIGAWLRALGWKTTKAIHALRAYSGSQVAMMTDLYTASRWLRHKNFAVTEKSYSGYVNQHAHSNRSQLKVSWAVIDPTKPK